MTPLQDDIDSLRLRLLAERGIRLDASAGGPFLVISRLEVPGHARGEGEGSAVMGALCELADAHGAAMALTPSADFGASSKSRLVTFYRRFGFRENRGRARDFTTREAMIRPRQGGARGNPCSTPGHRHPSRSRPVSHDAFVREFSVLWDRSGIRGTPHVHIDDQLAKRHARCERSYADVSPETLDFRFAPAALSLPPANLRGLLAHEIGHVLSPRGGEVGADEAARRVLGVDVTYDARWTGRAEDGTMGVQRGRRVR